MSADDFIDEKAGFWNVGKEINVVFGGVDADAFDSFVHLGFTPVVGSQCQRPVLFVSAQQVTHVGGGDFEIVKWDKKQTPLVAGIDIKRRVLAHLSQSDGLLAGYCQAAEGAFRTNQPVKAYGVQLVIDGITQRHQTQGDGIVKQHDDCQPQQDELEEKALYFWLFCHTLR